MRRLSIIICISLVAFAGASLLIYRLGTRSGSSNPPAPPNRDIVPEVNTLEGQGGSVDVDARTLTLVEGDREVVFSFDDRTSIILSGRAVSPDSIATGSGATVRYTSRAGKNFARRIELAESGDTGN
jgi:hypothetical protein